MTVTNGDNMDPRPLIGITMGDPLGIGPEVVVKALANEDLRREARFVIFGFHDALELAADQSEIDPYWWREPYDRSARVRSGVLCADFDELPQPRINGHRAANELAGRASLEFVEAGIRHLKDGGLDGLVTAPINKEAWQMARCREPGHTGLLRRRFEAKRVTMMFDAGPLRVALASDHVPLFDLRNRFTIGLVHQPIDLLDRALRDWYGVARPRIAVLGLNPHAGENGVLGDEERRIIEPALTMARGADIQVDGPLPADTAFTPDTLSRYDGIVAMYHDQGLIPVKMAAFHSAVNVTLGLGAVRTSPAHGTGFEIAGKNRAHPGSMISAIRLAIRFAKTQRERLAAAGNVRG